MVLFGFETKKASKWFFLSRKEKHNCPNIVQGNAQKSFMPKKIVILFYVDVSKNVKISFKVNLIVWIYFDHVQFKNCK